MSIVKIKVKCCNTEMEIEGPEDFLMKFLNSKCMSMSEPTNAKSKKMLS
jgi:hypothetical protein